MNDHIPDRRDSSDLTGLIYEFLPLKDEDILVVTSFFRQNLAQMRKDITDGIHFLVNICQRISFRSLSKFVVWGALYSTALYFKTGTLFMIVTIFYVMMTNFDTRRDGDLSGYSVFNQNFERLPGTLDAEQLDAEIRHNFPEPNLHPESDTEQMEESGQFDRQYLKEKKKELKAARKQDKAAVEDMNRLADAEYADRLTVRKKLLLARAVNRNT